MADAWDAARIALDAAELAARTLQSAGLLALHLAGPVRAVLYNLDEKDKSTETKAVDRGGTFKFQYNPESVTVSRSPSMNTGVGGTNFAGFEGGAGRNDTLSFSVWLDASDIGDGKGTAGTAAYAASAISPVTASIAGTTGTVLDQMKNLYALTIKKKVPGKEEYRLPVLAFLWKDLRFTGVMTSIDFETTMFDPLGNPRRCKATIRMEGRAFDELKATEVLDPVVAAGGIKEFANDGGVTTDVTASLKATALRVALRLI